MNKEPGPLPEHHKQWFQTLKDAAADDNLALVSCFDAKTGEPRSVITAVGWDGANYVMTPLGHLCTEDNPYDAYIAPQGRTVANDQR